VLLNVSDLYKIYTSLHNVNITITDYCVYEIVLQIVNDKSPRKIILENHIILHVIVLFTL